MNRTSLCIRMLQLLKARGKMNTTELATALEVNPRNIREFKKELVLAGYNIEERKGRYGGYVLNDTYDLPVHHFSDEEKDALAQGYQFMRTQSDFKSLESYMSAMEKIICSTKIEEDASHYYLQDSISGINENIKKMIDKTQKAIYDGRCVILLYQSLKDDKPKEFEVEPYEIIHYRQSYYLIGFSLLRNAFRMYRFSDQRMFKCEISQRCFLKDSNFKLRNYIGEHSLIPADLKEIKIRVNHEGIRLFKEKYWGNHLNVIDSNSEYSDFEFYTDDLYRLYRDTFSMRDDVEIISPKEVRQEYIENLKDILHTYKK